MNSNTGMNRTAIAAIVSIGVLMSGSVLAQSYKECEAYAIDVANQSVDRSTNIITGAVVGLLGGAVAGSLINDGQGAYTGAAVGSGAGALAGVAKSEGDWNHIYYAAYNDCRNGFPEETPVNYPVVPPWSEKWFEYCENKYRSFNPETGRYTTYTGAKKFCVYQGNGTADNN